jgi:uncharacterized damage-inducible protein DinB
VPSKTYVSTMARYNLWQNASLTAAANTLTGAERKEERGVFFGSIERTFSHLFWADQMWFARFTGTPSPGGTIEDSLELIDDWAAFCDARSALDQRILDWADGMDDDWSESGSSAAPKATFVIQFFNHQTHHRGQIHAMLTAAGARPEDTDVHKMPQRFLDL